MVSNIRGAFDYILLDMRCPMYHTCLMFIRRKQNKTSTAVQIVENHRIKSKTKQRVVRHVGSAKTQAKLEELCRLAKILDFGKPQLTKSA